ncbi:hypothetical protein [Pseudonocardia sp. MH-G8]|uniref:hypothetical protein n=1 Tax=Pseudonocardia sp. MH-G8 TaxID=1854588 RepID=UPI00117AB88E|nr:hypothetical protein [Pseudonocardia sp. MH-G8]
MLPAPRDPLPPEAVAPDPPLADRLTGLLRAAGASAARAVDTRGGAVLAEAGLAGGDDVAALVQLAHSALAAGRAHGEWLEDVVLTLGRTVHVLRECGAGAVVLHARLDPARGDVAVLRAALAEAALHRAAQAATPAPAPTGTGPAPSVRAEGRAGDTGERSAVPGLGAPNPLPHARAAPARIRPGPDAPVGLASVPAPLRPAPAARPGPPPAGPVAPGAPPQPVSASTATVPQMRPVVPGQPTAPDRGPAPPALPRPRPSPVPVARRDQEPALAAVDGGLPVHRTGALAVLALPPVAGLPRRRPLVPAPPAPHAETPAGPPVLQQAWASDTATMHRILDGLHRLR